MRECYPQNYSVLPCHFPVVSTSSPPCPRGHRCLQNIHGKWAGDSMEGISYWLTSCAHCGAGSLGSCCHTEFPASAQLPLMAQWFRWDAWFPGTKLCKQKIPRVTCSLGSPWETQELLVLGILHGAKKKETGTTVSLKGKYLCRGKLSAWSTAHPRPSATELRLTSPRSKESGKKEGPSPASSS